MLNLNKGTCRFDSCSALHLCADDGTADVGSPKGDRSLVNSRLFLRDSALAAFAGSNALERFPFERCGSDSRLPSHYLMGSSSMAERSTLKLFKGLNAIGNAKCGHDARGGQASPPRAFSYHYER